MFGKIKSKLKDVFKSNEDFVEENHDSLEEVEVPVLDEKKDISDKKKVDDEVPELVEKEVPELVEDDLEKDIPLPPTEEELGDLNEEVEQKEKTEEKKPGFLGRIFGSKKSEEDEVSEVEELENVEDVMLEEVPVLDEKKAIKEHTELDEDIVEENKKDLDDEIEKEEVVEKETVSDISDSKEMEEISEKISEEVESTPIEELNVESSSEETENIEEVEEENSDEEKESILLEEEKEGFFGKTFQKLKAKKISDDDFESIWLNLQMFLLEINIAFEIVEKIEKKLKSTLVGNSFNRFAISDKVREVLVEEVGEVLVSHEASFIDKLNSFSGDQPVKILVLGVNGTGKTTTIAKLVKFLQNQNKSVVVAAADTFRAAAVEQLEEHSKNLNFKLIMHKGGGDPAAVAYDAIEHANAKKLDVVLIDTAGRMPNNSNLMMELEKVKRVSKSDMAIFVGDSVAGNDLVEQIELFNKGVEIDGAVLTKVDTDERPGSVVTTAYMIDKPIYFLGVGQGYDDLIEFEAKMVAEKLFDVESDEDEE